MFHTTFKQNLKKSDLQINKICIFCSVADGPDPCWTGYWIIISSCFHPSVSIFLFSVHGRVNKQLCPSSLASPHSQSHADGPWIWITTHSLQMWPSLSINNGINPWEMFPVQISECPGGAGPFPPHIIITPSFYRPHSAPGVTPISGDQQPGKLAPINTLSGSRKADHTSSSALLDKREFSDWDCRRLRRDMVSQVKVLSLSQRLSAIQIKAREVVPCPV